MYSSGIRPQSAVTCAELPEASGFKFDESQSWEYPLPNEVTHVISHTKTDHLHPFLHICWIDKHPNEMRRWCHSLIIGPITHCPREPVSRSIFTRRPRYMSPIKREHQRWESAKDGTTHRIWFTLQSAVKLRPFDKCTKIDPSFFGTAHVLLVIIPGSCHHNSLLVLAICPNPRSSVCQCEIPLDHLLCVPVFILCISSPWLPLCSSLSQPSSRIITRLVRSLTVLPVNSILTTLSSCDPHCRRIWL